MRLLLAAALAFAATPALALDFTSPDVSDGQPFPTKFICAAQGGTSTSPTYAWSGAPAGTKSFAITIHDPDAPAPGGFWHWVIADLPGASAGLAQGAASQGGTLPAGALPLPNGAHHAYYDGPCPPPGKVHHYVTTLYALPLAKAPVKASMTPPQVDAWLAKHALARTVMTPVFEKK